MQDNLFYLGILEHDDQRADTEEIRAQQYALMNVLLEELTPKTEASTNLKDVQYLMAGYYFFKVREALEVPLAGRKINAFQGFRSHLEYLEKTCYNIFSVESSDEKELVHQLFWKENFLHRVGKLGNVQKSEELRKRTLTYLSALGRYLNSLNQEVLAQLLGIKFQKEIVPLVVSEPVDRFYLSDDERWNLNDFENEGTLFYQTSQQNLGQFYSLSAWYLQLFYDIGTNYDLDELENGAYYTEVVVTKKPEIVRDLLVMFKANGLIEIDDDDIIWLVRCLFPSSAPRLRYLLNHPYLPNFNIPSTDFYREFKAALHIMVDKKIIIGKKVDIVKLFERFFPGKGMSKKMIGEAIRRGNTPKFKILHEGEVRSILRVK